MLFGTILGLLSVFAGYRYINHYEEKEWYDICIPFVLGGGLVLGMVMVRVGGLEGIANLIRTGAAQ